MALVHADFVRETTTTTGTGPLGLGGATTGCRTFVSAIGDGNTCYYAIESSAGQFESGIGTVADASPHTLARTTLIASSTGSKLDLPAGTHTVYCTFSASGVGAVASRASSAQVPRGDDPRLTLRTWTIPLSPPGVNLSAGAKKAFWKCAWDCTITGFDINCDPADKPSTAHAQFDLNTVHSTTGAETSILSATAQVNIGSSSGVGTISGTTYSYSANTLMAIDCDQGNDGKLYFATITTSLAG